jgi:hypothetical protein
MGVTLRSTGNVIAEALVSQVRTVLEIKEWFELGAKQIALREETRLLRKQALPEITVEQPWIAY